METIIKIIQVISDNRFWILPILLAGILYVLAVEIKNVLIGIIKEME